MPDFDIFAIGESALTISGGAQLSGVTQGDGSHLEDLFITLNASAFEQITITDNDDFIADNDGNQRLTNATTFDGVAYAANARVEAEYTLTLSDGAGNTFIAYGLNFATDSPPFGTVEGLVFVGERPPLGVALEVISTSEGPNNSTTMFTDIFSPPCFVAGTELDTPDGGRLVERLKIGDLVSTLDHGARPVVWIGSVHLTQDALWADRSLCPVRLAAPNGELRVSQQYRMLVSGWRTEMVCGASEVLVPAKHLAESGQGDIQSPSELPNGVDYWHVMFDDHEIVMSNGVPSESFLPGPEALKSMPAVSREFRQLFPGFDLGTSPFKCARHSAAAYEARVLAQDFMAVSPS